MEDHTDSCRATFAHIKRPPIRYVLVFLFLLLFLHLHLLLYFPNISISLHFLPIMVTVAIAGGTGKLGRTIAEVLRASNKHQIIILSRQVLNPNIHLKYGS